MEILNLRYRCIENDGIVSCIHRAFRWPLPSLQFTSNLGIVAKITAVFRTFQLVIIRRIKPTTGTSKTLNPVSVCLSFHNKINKMLL